MIYNLEYELLDKIGRAKKTSHVGVFSDLDKVEEVKQRILIAYSNDKIKFNVHLVQELFSR